MCKYTIWKEIEWQLQISTRFESKRHIYSILLFFNKSMQVYVYNSAHLQSLLERDAAGKLTWTRLILLQMRAAMAATISMMMRSQMCCQLSTLCSACLATLTGMTKFQRVYCLERQHNCENLNFLYQKTHKYSFKNAR